MPATERSSYQGEATRKRERIPPFRRTPLSPVSRSSRESTIADRLRNRYRAGPILERSGDLASRILADWDDESVVVGSNQTFGPNVLAAAVHHFGTRDGGVPARPFFAVSDEARNAILRALIDHLDSA